MSRHSIHLTPESLRIIRERPGSLSGRINEIIQAYQALIKSQQKQDKPMERPDPE